MATNNTKIIKQQRNNSPVQRTVIPVEIRNRLNIKPYDYLEIFTTDDSIVLKKYVQNCVFCGSQDDGQIFKEQYICNNCKQGLKGDQHD